MDPSPKETSEDSILDVYLRATAELWKQLCACELAVEQKRAFGGMLFPSAIAYVQAMAEGINEHPELFSQIPVRAEELDREQQRALDLLFVHRGLLALAQLSYDAYLGTQASALRKSHLVIKQIRAETNLPICSRAQREDNERRNLWTTNAQKLLKDRKSLRKKSRPTKKTRKP